MISEKIYTFIVMEPDEDEDDIAFRRDVLKSLRLLELARSSSDPVFPKK